MKKRKKIVAANWKMHGNRDTVKQFAGALSQLDDRAIDIMFAPPSVYLATAAEIKHKQQGNWLLTAQCGHHEETGAFTGAVSMDMLKDIGCDAVLIGHSERRQLQGESNLDCLKQIKSALRVGLIPVLCIGETEADYQAEKTEDVLSTQLSGVLDELNSKELSNLVIAYEPVWAIGTGQVADPSEVNKIHQIIHRQIATKHDRISPLICVLYGGSVKPSNANELFSEENVAGALVGGASLKFESFVKIIDSADRSVAQ